MKRIVTCAVWMSLGAMAAARAQDAKPEAVNGPGSTLSQAARAKLPHSPTLPYGLRLMARFDLLPLLRDTKCVQDSSYDRTGGNGDLGQFLQKDGNSAVLADMRGPGCIYRFWSANAAGQLRIFFDGEKTPRVDCPMQDFFLGKVAPFVTPLVGHKSGGWYSFFPMPFQKGCRIEVTDPGPMYYHVEYQLFPDGTPVHTFTRDLTPDDQKALDTILDQWGHLGDDPKAPAAGRQDLSGKTTCAPGETRTMATVNGPGEITMLRVQLMPADRFSLRQALLRVYWDGAAKPGIEAPVGDFFGVGFGGVTFRALPDAMTDDGCVCYWPMPFAKSARFELFNAGQSRPLEAAWNLSTLPLKKPLPDVGYFHAQWHRQTTAAGEPFHILQTTGRGHYVGEHTDMQSDRGIGYLEGDEMIYVDGETFPSIYGTGTEDFYTGGWYFDEGPFNLAYHGCTLKKEDMSRVAAYRYQIQDCVPFQKGLKIDIEHGGNNDYPGADYACVAYWYQDSPSHDWSPVDPAQLTPAFYRVAGASEAENLNWSGGKTEARDDTGFRAEASAGKVMAVSGEKPTATIDVPNDDVYNVHFSCLTAPDSLLKMEWRVDDDADMPLFFLDESGNPDILQQGRWDLFAPRRLKPGKHTFTLSSGGDKPAYLDYIELLPSQKEKGVIEAERLTEQADTGSMGKVSREDGELAASSGSYLQWTPEKEGAALKLPVSVPADGDYSLELGVVTSTTGITVAAQLDDTELAALDTYGAGVGAKRLQFGRITGLKQGAHTLTLTSRGRSHPNEGEGAVLLLDYIRLRKSRYPYSIETESLKIVDAQGGQATHQEMQGFGQDWSGDDQFWFLGQKAGAEATLELPVQTAGKYDLSAYYTTARDYAIVQVLMDGKEVGPPTDCYTPNVRAKGKTELGQVDLTAGTHRLTFRAAGKNPSSNGYLLGVDAVGLEPVK